ncbi:MAG: hypothetical protein JKY31_05675 [Rhodobacteraceae bacterium]|nr:hypothetical protein [Paracoccaceae bacterium]
MTIRPQYHFRPSANGVYAWDVSKLISATATLIPFAKPLSEIAEIDEDYWFAGDPIPSVRAIAAHMDLVRASDLTYPIILCAEGRLMDGMHRIAKALMQGDITLQAVQFTITPAPDHTDVTPEQLQY